MNTQELIDDLMDTRDLLKGFPTRSIVDNRLGFVDARHLDACERLLEQAAQALTASQERERVLREALRFYRCECAECGVDGCEWGAFGSRECGLIARQALQSTEQQG